MNPKRPIRASVAVKLTWAVILVLVLGLLGHLYSRRSSRAAGRPGLAELGLAQAGGTLVTRAAPERSRDSASQQRSCHTESNADYWAENVVVWGPSNRKDSAEECCAACDAHPTCNVWVWCGGLGGCGGGREQHECWLKHTDDLNPLHPRGNRQSNSMWVSGAKYSDDEYKARVDALAAKERAESDRLAKMRNDPARTLVYLDVAIKGTPIGRMEFVLFTEESPLAAENFRALCTGEKGIVPPGREGAGKPYHFKGAYFYRIIDQFIDQTGAGTESVYGGMFKDDPGGLALKHDRKGLLSAANMGPDTNGSHFSIVVAPAPHLNGHYTIFGELVSGWDVAAQINALARGKPDNTAGIEEQAQIIDSGQIR